MSKPPLFRAWDNISNFMLYFDEIEGVYNCEANIVIETLASNIPNVYSAPGKNCEIMQWIEKDDKKGQHIFVGDILKIRVLRHDGDATTPNKNHGSYYLYAEVMDLRGNLRYNRDAIEALRQPMGKEIFAQSVGYDYRLFHELYYCVHLKKDKTGNYVIEGDNSLGNYKRFHDYEVVGNIKENPELMDSLEIMKVPKSEAILS